MPTIKQMVRDAIIPSLAAPAVAEAGDINTGITLLKRSVVGYLNEHHPAPKEVIAPYLGKSVRWLYRMMEPAEELEEDLQADRLQKLIFLHLRRYHPEYLPVSELHAYLRRCRLRYPRSILEDLLSFYVSLDFVEQDPADPTMYRATERLTQTATRPFRDRKVLLEQHCAKLYPLADSYVRELPGSMMDVIEARIPEEHVVKASDEIRDAIAAVLTRYEAMEGSKVGFKALVMSGRDD